MYNILDIIKSTLVGKQIKVYIHKHISPSGLEYDLIDVSNSSDRFEVRTIADIDYDWDAEDGREWIDIILDKPIILSNCEIIRISIDYLTNLELI